MAILWFKQRISLSVSLFWCPVSQCPAADGWGRIIRNRENIEWAFNILSLLSNNGVGTYQARALVWTPVISEMNSIAIPCSHSPWRLERLLLPKLCYLHVSSCVGVTAHAAWVFLRHFWGICESLQTKDGCLFPLCCPDLFFPAGIISEKQHGFVVCLGEPQITPTSKPCRMHQSFLVVLLGRCQTMARAYTQAPPSQSRCTKPKCLQLFFPPSRDITNEIHW